jgi:hypothetical protein
MRIQADTNQIFNYIFRKENKVVLIYLPEKAAHILGGAGV